VQPITKVFLGCGLVAATGIGLDAALHPQVYLSQLCTNAAGYIEPVSTASANTVSPPFTQVIPSTELPIPTPAGSSFQASLPGKEPSLARFSLSEVGSALKRGRLREYVDASVEWEAGEVAPYAVMAADPASGRSSPTVALMDSSGEWFCLRGTSDEEIRTLRDGLKKNRCLVSGTLEGAPVNVVLGPEWYQWQEVPCVKMSELRWKDAGDAGNLPARLPLPRPLSVAKPEAGSIESVSPTPLPVFKEPSPAQTRVPHDIQLVPQKERGSALAAGPEFAWSLRHVLYDEDAWILSEQEFQRLERWGGTVRSRFKTLENSMVRQQVVDEFIDLIGLDKALKAGVLFNDGQGLPLYRWPPPNRPEEDLKDYYAPPPVPRPGSSHAALGEMSTGAHRGGRLTTSSARGSAQNEGALQEQVLRFLIEGGEIVHGVCAQGQEGTASSMIEESDRVFSLGDGQRCCADLLASLDQSRMAAFIFRIQPVLFDRIALKFGKPQKRLPDSYPRLPGREGSNRPPSIVWEVYGGVQVARPNSEEEPSERAGKSILVRIDLPRWNQLRSKRNTS
jgi:hypothetical protein